MTSRPTHHIIIKDKENKFRKTLAGVAWVNAEGWFSIALNPGIVLTAELCENYYVNMYPTKEYEEKIRGGFPPLESEDTNPPVERETPF